LLFTLFAPFTLKRKNDNQLLTLGSCFALVHTAMPFDYLVCATQPNENLRRCNFWGVDLKSFSRQRECGQVPPRAPISAVSQGSRLDFLGFFRRERLVNWLSPPACLPLRYYGVLS